MTSGDGILIDGVSLSYNGRSVLNNICMEIEKGKVVTLLGPNGCGKTTLLKIINGLLPQTSGRVYVDGRDTRSIRPNEMARLMGHVPQAHRSTFPFTVLDVVLTGRLSYISPLSKPGKRDLEKAYRALEMVAALHLADRPYNQISGGERQLAMIARALAQEPSFLLLDEPTSYLDFRNQIRILKTVRGFAESGLMTVVMSLHDPNHALIFSDRIVLMRKVDGDPSEMHNVIAMGAPEEVMTVENIRAAYGIDVEMLEIKGRRLLFPL
ncbi:MAG: ABC transporter ATP-binding protein [Methanothrix sp.]|uniref:ABC transporter ATP-binding protein n=1 Tax=Methanothrix sp. TaxID=90426 RepID=UPI0031671EC9|nr:ABC transporter ATP-binding protein [Methanothrix sp.]